MLISEYANILIYFIRDKQVFLDINLKIAVPVDKTHQVVLYAEGDQSVQCCEFQIA
jgi:hypothetical protein